MLKFYQMQTNPVFKSLASQIDQIINDLKVDINQLYNIDPAKLTNTLSNIKELQPLSQAEYTTDVNFYILPNYSSPTNDVAQMTALLDNIPKLAYFYAEQSSPLRLYLKQMGTYGGTQALANIVPSFNKKGVVFRGSNYLILQAELNLPGMIYAVALPSGSKKPFAVQIVNGQNANNAMAASNSSNFTREDSFGNLLPVRVNLSGLTNASTYDIYYIAGNYIPGFPMTSPTVYALSGAKVLSSSNKTTSFSTRIGKKAFSFM